MIKITGNSAASSIHLGGGVGIQISNPIPAARFLVTTTGAQTLTLNSFGGSREIVVSWGDGSSSSYAGTALRTHNYAGAGTWTVTISDPLAVTVFDVRDNKITLNSADIMSLTNVETFIAIALKAGTFSSADVSAWRPTYFYLYSMPAGYVVTAGGGFAGWTTTNNFRVQGNALSQATVNAILWELYQAAATPRTVTGGTINVGLSNSAPSGTFQAPASCPVTVATPGKEVAHALLNDGCAVGFNKWTTVTVTA